MIDVGYMWNYNKTEQIANRVHNKWDVQTVITFGDHNACRRVCIIVEELQIKNACELFSFVEHSWCKNGIARKWHQSNAPTKAYFTKPFHSIDYGQQHKQKIGVQL